MIRHARREDFAALWTLLKDMHREQALFSLNPEKAMRVLAGAIDGGRVLVAEKDGVIAGTFAWEEAVAYYSDDPFISDLWMYVAPKHRRSAVALRLRNAMKAEARALGVPLMAGAVGKTWNGARLFGRDFIKAGEIFFMR
jgi:GNAT superfamily N-acetyltransferase